MSRFFEAEKKADILLKEYCEVSKSKVANAINTAIYCWFLPNYVTELKLEANYLLQLKEENGEVSELTIRQAISRGLSWLGKHPIMDATILRNMNLNFTLPVYEKALEDTRNDYVKGMFREAENIMDNIDVSYIKHYPCWGNFGSDILDQWDKVWDKKVMYDVLSYIVFSEEAKKPISVYDAIIFLKSIEEAVIEQTIKG